MSRDSLITELVDLLDTAISIGRNNWDGYYGHDNQYHLSAILESDEYKKFLNMLNKC